MIYTEIVLIYFIGVALGFFALKDIQRDIQKKKRVLEDDKSNKVPNITDTDKFEKSYIFPLVVSFFTWPLILVIYIVRNILITLTQVLRLINKK